MRDLLSDVDVEVETTDGDVKRVALRPDVGGEVSRRGSPHCGDDVAASELPACVVQSTPEMDCSAAPGRLAGHENHDDTGPTGHSGR